MDPPKLTRKDEHIRHESRKRVELAMAYNFLRGDRDQPFLLPGRRRRPAPPLPTGPADVGEEGISDGEVGRWLVSER
jgi:hypothetical protein